eukprot:XP_019920897.1 PREDICTED: uncharacterized protein LOC105323930 [Crassostrea gigas]
MENKCNCIKDVHASLNLSYTDSTQQLPLNCRYNVSNIRYNGSECTLITMDRSSGDVSSSKLPSFEVAATTTVKSPQLNSKNEEFKDFVGAIVGLVVAVFALTSSALLLWFYIKKRKRKLPDSQNDVQQPQSSPTVNNIYSDMMLVSGTNQNQNEVVVTTSTTMNDVRNDDIYVENEEGEYDHLHSSRPKQGVSEREDERYATSSQLEDVTYSTVRKSRKSIPERDNDYY